VGQRSGQHPSDFARKRARPPPDEMNVIGAAPRLMRVVRSSSRAVRSRRLAVLNYGNAEGSIFSPASVRFGSNGASPTAAPIPSGDIPNPKGDIPSGDSPNRGGIAKRRTRKPCRSWAPSDCPLGARWRTVRPEA
jgi:hypothetical protein